jgi:integrase
VHERCTQHVCRPLAGSTVRQIHWILSGAMDRAVRWRWIGKAGGLRADETDPISGIPPVPRQPTVRLATRPTVSAG